MTKSKKEVLTEEITVDGMQCKSCEKIIKSKLDSIKGVKKNKVEYTQGIVKVTYDKSKIKLSEIMASIDEEGYCCVNEERTPRFSGGRLVFTMSELKNSLILVGAFLLVFGGYMIVKDHTGFSMPELNQNTSIALIFTLGLLTGFHCIAMCGGLVLSYSANSKKKGIDYKAHLSYGFGKTISYAFFGALFGFAGSFFTFTPAMRGAAAILAGVFLLLFGLNMLDIFKSFRKVRFKTPGFIQEQLSNTKNKGPLSIGLLNGLMIACGPLQALYVFAAASGSPYYGALYLGAFGLGTLPVLLGFGVLASAISSSMKHKLFRFSAVLVIALGLIMVNRGLALTGTGYDVNTILVSNQPIEAANLGEDNTLTLNEAGFQEIRMTVDRYGWKPDTFILKKGVPVKWIIQGKEITGCNNAIQVPKLNLQFDIKSGEQIIEFTPEDEGNIPWSCWMGMIPGLFVVKEDIDISQPEAIQKELAKIEPPKTTGGSCGGSCGSPTCGAARGGSCGCGG